MRPSSPSTYALGLGIPFVALALAYDRLAGVSTFLRRNGHTVERVGGVFLLLVGIGYLTDRWTRVFVPLQAWFAQWGWTPL